MIIDEVIKTAIEAIIINKARSFLTMLGIIIGVAAVILLISIGSGLQKFITQQFEDLGSNLVIVMPGKVSFQDEGAREGGQPGIASNRLTLEISNKLEKKMQYAGAVLPIVAKTTVAKYGNNSHSTGLVASNEKYEMVRNSPVSLGRTFTKADIDGSKKVAIIGSSLQNELFKNINPIGKKILVSDSRYTIIGVFEEKGAIMGQDMDDVVTIPITAAIRQFNIEKLNYIYIQSPDSDTTTKTVAEAKRLLLKEMDEDDFSVLDQKDLASSIQSILGVLTAALGGIAAISLLVGGIGIMNIMLVSVTERTREIGLRKAVGAKPNDILIQFLVEAIILSVIGGTIGLLIGIGGSLALSSFLKTSVTIWSMVLAVGFSSLVGIIFGVAPAYKASKLDPINALRYE